MSKLLSHFGQNAIAYLALFVALGGTGYAVVNLPANSVGTRQLRNGAVTAKKLANGMITTSKFDHRSIRASVRYWAEIDQNGHVVASQPRAQTLGSGGGSVSIQWQGALPKSDANGCFSLANAAGGFASVFGASPKDLLVRTYDFTGHPATEPVDVAVLCIN